jgi:hypothetical protein
MLASRVNYSLAFHRIHRILLGSVANNRLFYSPKSTRWDLNPLQLRTFIASRCPCANLFSGTQETVHCNKKTILSVGEGIRQNHKTTERSQTVSGAHLTLANHKHLPEGAPSTTFFSAWNEGALEQCSSVTVCHPGDIHRKKTFGLVGDLTKCQPCLSRYNSNESIGLSSLAGMFQHGPRRPH